MEPNYTSIKVIAEAWDISLRQMQMYCKAGRIPGAKKENNTWIVPVDVKRPENIRNLSGEERILNIKHRLATKDKTNQDSTYLRIMSHEIRNNLNAILGFTEIMKNHPESPVDNEQYVDIIQESGYKMLDLVNNISDLSKLQKGEMREENHIFNIEKLLLDLIEAHNAIPNKHNIKVETKTNLKNEYVFGDQDKIFKILYAILENSVNYSKENSTVTLNITEEESNELGFCTISYIITDQSDGIPSNRLSHIYDILSADGVKLNNDYFGIGLIYAHRFTNFLKGQLQIHSYYGNGTTVSVTFNHRIADISSLTNDSPALSTQTEGLKGKRILIADDNEINREIAKEVLVSAGMECECAEDGIICIAMLEQHPEKYYDLILMDLQMPNVDGILATVLIRKLDNKEKSNIPIIAMTANVQTENKEQALKAGMNGFVEKPFNSKTLFKVIENCIVYK